MKVLDSIRKQISSLELKSIIIKIIKNAKTQKLRIY